MFTFHRSLVFEFTSMFVEPVCRSFNSIAQQMLSESFPPSKKTFTLNLPIQFSTKKLSLGMSATRKLALIRFQRTCQAHTLNCVRLGLVSRKETLCISESESRRNLQASVHKKKLKTQTMKFFNKKTFCFFFFPLSRHGGKTRRQERRKSM